jgi:hypothetical protein
MTIHVNIAFTLKGTFFLVNCLFVVRFEVFTAVTMKNGVFWDVTLLRRVALVRTDVSEELDPSFIRVTRISELGTTQAATSNRSTLRRNTLFSSLFDEVVVKALPYKSEGRGFETRSGE